MAQLLEYMEEAEGEQFSSFILSRGVCAPIYVQYIAEQNKKIWKQIAVAWPRVHKNE